MGKFLKKAPCWFNLENYDKYSDCNLEIWVNELEARLRLYELIFSNHVEEDEYEEQKLQARLKLRLSHIMSTGSAILPEEKDFDVVALLKETYGPPLENTYEPETKLVSSLSQYDAYKITLIAEGYDDLAGKYDEVKNIKGWSNQSMHYREMKQKFGVPIHNKLPVPAYKYLRINPNASDEQLVDDFKKWLTVIRKREHVGSPQKKTKLKKLREWHEYRVIPLFDLWILTRPKGKQISYSMLADMLFPDSYDVDVEERIRKVSMKKLKEAFNPSTIRELSVQLKTL